MKTFNKDLLPDFEKVLVKFGAPWCGPCKALNPVLEELVEDGYPIYDINTDEDQDLAVEYQIRSVPTLVLFEGGIESKRVIGAQTKQQIINLLEE